MKRIGLWEANQRFSELVIRRLQSMGLVRAATKQTALPRWTARPLKGVPLSRTLRDERDRV